MYQEKSREEPRTSANTIIDSLNKTKNTFTSESVAIGERGVDEPWLVDISKTGQPLDVYSRYVNKITGKVVRGRVSDKVRADFYSKTQYYKHLKDPKNILDDQERAKIRMTNGTLLHESLEDLINFLKVGKTKEKNQVSRPQNLTPGVIFRVESESEVEICRKMAAEWTNEEKRNFKLCKKKVFFIFLSFFN